MSGVIGTDKRDSIKNKGRIFPAFVFYSQKVRENHQHRCDVFSCEKTRSRMKLPCEVVVDKLFR